MENEIVVYVITLDGAVTENGKEIFHTDNSYVATKRTFEAALELIKKEASFKNVQEYTEFNKSVLVDYSGLIETCLGVYEINIERVTRTGDRVKEHCTFRIGRELL